MKKRKEAARPVPGVLASMTGFGRGRAEAGGVEVTVSIRSVNGRFLQVKTHLPPEAEALQPKLVEALRGAVSRGTVDLGAEVSGAAGASAYRLDEAAARKHAEDLRRLGKALRLPGEPSLALVAGLPGVVTRASEAGAEERLARPFEKALAVALDAFVAMRRREGKALGEAIRAQASAMREAASRVRERAPEILATLRERLLARTREMAASAGAALAEGALEREVVQAAREADVTEELDRLASHLDQVEETLVSGGGVGKKLDFLAQEMNREANTLGSKSSDEGVSRAVIEIKEAIERLREQVQNLE